MKKTPSELVDQSDILYASSERTRENARFQRKLAGAEVVFEIKEIVSDHAWDDDVVHRRTVGEMIRNRINSSKGQIQTAARQGKPTVLLIYNVYDPLQLFGTEDHDFEHAMYGADTLLMCLKTRRIVDRFHGHGKSFQAAKNTSFSAVGRIKEEGRADDVKVTLFENIHAKVPIDFEACPLVSRSRGLSWSKLRKQP